MVDGSSLMVMQGVVETISHVEMFSNPGTQGVTGISEAKTVLFVFDEGEVAEWQDPPTGNGYFVRPLRSAFIARRSIAGAAYLGYRPKQDGIRTLQQLVVWDDTRKPIAHYPDVRGLRKEQ